MYGARLGLDVWVWLCPLPCSDLQFPQQSHPRPRGVWGRASKRNEECGRPRPGCTWAPSPGHSRRHFLAVLTQGMGGGRTFGGGLGVGFSLNGLEWLEWEDLRDRGRGLLLEGGPGKGGRSRFQAFTHVSASDLHSTLREADTLLHLIDAQRAGAAFYLQSISSWFHSCVIKGRWLWETPTVLLCSVAFLASLAGWAGPKFGLPFSAGRALLGSCTSSSRKLTCEVTLTAVPLLLPKS